MERGKDYHDSRRLEKPPNHPGPAPAVGALLQQRFLLSALIAHGGTAAVYQARDRRQEQTNGVRSEIAVKFFHGASANIPPVAMAAREATLAAAVRHPGIVHIHDMHALGQRAYLTMEWIPGETLAQRLARMPGGRLPQEQAIPLTVAVAEALAACHAAGIAHGDVKPANILLAGNGVRLVDFTTAHQFASSARPLAAVPSEPIAGYSRLYASPRVLEGALPSPPDDIHALAVVAYQMLTGRTPFAPHGSLTARDQGVPPERPADLGWLRWQMLRRGLTADPQNAPDDVARFANALERPGRSLVFPGKRQPARAAGWER